MTVMEPGAEWDVGRELARLQEEMGRSSQRAPRRMTPRRARVYPPIIISAVDDTLVIRAEVPGAKLEDLEISVSGDTLTIQGQRITGQGLEGGWYHCRERESGGFSRAVRLPADVDGNRAEAAYEAGVLAIKLPLKERVKPRRIPVQVVEG